jgi:hypothetical protein
VCYALTSIFNWFRRLLDRGSFREWNTDSRTNIITCTGCCADTAKKYTFIGISYFTRVARGEFGAIWAGQVTEEVVESFRDLCLHLRLKHGLRCGITGGN